MTRLEVRRLPLRHTLVRRPTPARRAGLTWPRLPAAAEVAIVAVGYFGYALVRLAVRAGRHAAFAHAAELWRAERWLHPDAEPSLNHLAAAHPDAAAGAASIAAGLLATRRRAPGHAPARPPAGPLPGLFPRSAARRWPTDPAGSTRPALLAWWPPQRPPAARPRTAKEIGMTTTRTPPPVSPPEQAIAPAGPPIRVRLPVGGWQVGFRIQPDGRTVIEVTDQDETLTGLVTSTRLPITSIDAGWSGLTRDPAGGRHWWALAIGHVPADAGQPTVTFTRRTRHRPGVAPPDAVDGLWFAHDGLWVAAATGHHTLARLTTRSATQVRRLRPVTAQPAATAQAHPAAR